MKKTFFVFVTVVFSLVILLSSVLCEMSFFYPIIALFLFFSTLKFLAIDLKYNE